MGNNNIKKIHMNITGKAVSVVMWLEMRIM
jgi:hypothetical protein